MKTRDQVMTWLVYQDTYNKVIKYLKGQGKDFEDALKEEGEDLFGNAYFNAKTDEEREFWKNNRRLFRDFYNSPKSFLCYHSATLVATVWKMEGMKVTEEELLAKCPEAHYAVIKDDVCYLYKTGINIAED